MTWDRAIAKYLYPNLCIPKIKFLDEISKYGFFSDPICTFVFRE